MPRFELCCDDRVVIGEKVTEVRSLKEGVKAEAHSRALDAVNGL